MYSLPSSARVIHRSESRVPRRNHSRGVSFFYIKLERAVPTCPRNKRSATASASLNATLSKRFTSSRRAIIDSERYTYTRSVVYRADACILYAKPLIMPGYVRHRVLSLSRGIIIAVVLPTAPASSPWISPRGRTCARSAAHLPRGAPFPRSFPPPRASAGKSSQLRPISRRDKNPLPGRLQIARSSARVCSVCVCVCFYT